ncbi:TIGR04086 family membrane protein [Bartonella massiliensis]|uniref:TIGR04086 family membrane protein n=1 Tax=Bartonella massiliensis TaxID=929795 RepID=UPI00115C332B|nr:TIGR04086 family membrane protein [Bartonella massiliensis]
METRIPENTPFDTNFLGETSQETKYSFFHTPISWSAIFAGLVTALAVSICLSFLIAALGLSQMDFTSSSPFRGSFLSMGIGSLIVMLISLALGGFVAGRFAETAGALHGFLTWALITLLMALQAIHVVSSTAKIGAKAVGNSTSIIQQTVDNLPSLFSKINSENFEKFFATNNDNDINFDQLGNELRTLLNKSDIPALNLDRLKQTYQAALNDIGSAITAFKNDPSHYRATLKNLGDRLSNRLEALTEKFNQSDIIKALMNNGMSRADAQTATTRAVQLYQSAEEKTGQALKALEKQADTLSQKLDARTKDALHMADKVTNTASHMGWWGFLGSLIGAIISSVCGYYGYRSRKDILKI